MAGSGQRREIKSSYVGRAKLRATGHQTGCGTGSAHTAARRVRTAHSDARPRARRSRKCACRRGSRLNSTLRVSACALSIVLICAIRAQFLRDYLMMLTSYLVNIINNFNITLIKLLLLQCTWLVRRTFEYSIQKYCKTKTPVKHRW